MINLSQYPKIEVDIKSKQTTLTPLLVIDSTSDNPIYISTVKGLFGNNIFLEDRGLDIKSIKESLDLIERRFKINNDLHLCNIRSLSFEI